MSVALTIARTTPELRTMLAALRSSGQSIALVPTMGCLHAGHVTLIREARKLADIVVVSIYVNPLQFGPNEDFASYPRSFEADAAVCRGAGADIIFNPSNLYPEGGPLVSLMVSGLSDVLCGATRP
ncbi:MAG: pantoate--beta-alanine ligase, partial [Mariprofundaceae bacterium]|nr:pantoate--beta-alanine ligase [Mariprofundaceae bacterium]